MKNIDVVKAWKNPEYRESLTDEERKSLPDNPAGVVELSHSDCSNVVGGVKYQVVPAFSRSLSFFTGTCGRVCRIITPKYGCDYSA